MVAFYLWHNSDMIIFYIVNNQLKTCKWYDWQYFFLRTTSMLSSYWTLNNTEVAENQAKRMSHII